MKRQLKLYTLNEDYGEYLKQYDYRVPDSTKNKSNRPFLGIIIEVNNLSYYVPLTSPKAKHKFMNNTIDFVKIENGRYGAINFNNMIPVPEEFVSNIQFNSMAIKDIEDAKYKELLKNQLRWCQDNKEQLFKKAHKVYDIVFNGKNEKLILRSCDFKLLEEKCRNFQKEKYFKKNILKDKGKRESFSLLEKDRYKREIKSKDKER